MSEASLGRVVRQVGATLKRVPDLRNGRIVVACSGGKDSLVLAAALRNLGFDPIAALVDLGYDHTWADRVRSHLATLDVESLVLSPDQAKSREGVFLGTLDQLQRNLSIVNSELDPGATPCTACYNSKVLLIQGEFESMSPQPIVTFGHHASDAAASLMKSVFMFMDRWDLGNEAYDRDRFRLACQEFGDRMLAWDRDLITRIQEIVESGSASTDEPFMQQLVVGNQSSLTLVRPLIDVWEHQIVDAANELNVTPESSGCGHTATLNTQTPREIVLFEVIHRVEMRPEWRELLTTWINFGQENGHLTVDARRRRAEILGSSYKTSPGGIEKL